MVGRRIYDLMYRYWAPWDAVGVRDELRTLVENGTLTPDAYPRAVDLGCGTGANVVYLAEQGFDATGIDFSPVALDQARKRAADAGVTHATTWIQGDLLADRIDGTAGPYDLLLDFGVLDDFPTPQDRERMVATARRLSRPGSRFLFWCFYAARDELPRISFVGPSRLTPAVEPGEEVELFGDDWDIERLPAPPPPERCAAFLLTRR